MSEQRKRRAWSKESMLAAVAAVNRKEMGSRKASLLFGVPRTTLRDQLHSDPEDIINRRLGRKTIFPPELEEELVKYCHVMQKTNSPLKKVQLRAKAFELAKKHDLAHRFSPSDKEKAGRAWLKLFLRRHPEISVGKTPGSSARAQKLEATLTTPVEQPEEQPLEEPPVGYTREDVEKFFGTLKKELERINCAPHRLYAVDETAFTFNQVNKTNVIALDNGYAVQNLSSPEKSVLVTLISCVSAVGSYVPPMMIFPRSRMSPELMNGVPPGTVGGCHASGWVQAEVYVRWLKHFAAHVTPSAENPVVLVLNGHQNYMNKCDVIQTARENFISLISLPPGSSVQMQPLRVAFGQLLKQSYTREIGEWRFCNPQRVVTLLQVGELLGNAYVQVASVKNAINGFKSTGIFPFHPNLLVDLEFVIEESPARGQNGTAGRRKGRGRKSVATMEDLSDPEDELLDEEEEEETPKRRRKRVPARAATEPSRGRARKEAQEKATPIRRSTRSTRRKLDVTPPLEEEIENGDIEQEKDEGGEKCVTCGGLLSQARVDEKWAVCENCYGGSQSV